MRERDLRKNLDRRKSGVPLEEKAIGDLGNVGRIRQEAPSEDIAANLLFFFLFQSVAFPLLSQQWRLLSGTEEGEPAESVPQGERGRGSPSEAPSHLVSRLRNLCLQRCSGQRGQILSPRDICRTEVQKGREGGETGQL